MRKTNQGQKKMGRKKTQITHMRNEKGTITTDFY